jgi:hypothetical protein
MATSAPSAPLMKVTGGRVPNFYSARLEVTELTWQRIVVRDVNPASKSDFLMTIFVMSQVEEPQHVLERGELEVRCTLQWNTDNGLTVLEGTAALRNDGSIRCDSMNSLEFWMELHPTR